MQIIIPMAGHSRRFAEAGYKIPKYLIEIEKKPMIEHVVNMYPEEEDFLFICNKEHIGNGSIRKILKQLKPKSQLAVIDSHKLGPVYSVLEAKEYIKDKEPNIVSYCDFNLGWDYNHFKKFVQRQKAAGAVVCYKGFHPHLLGPDFYAGVLTTAKNKILEIREKHSFTENKMDCWQSAGNYYFQSGALLKKYFQQLVDKKIQCNGEYYVGLVYNLLIQDKLSNFVYPVDYFCQWGTPKDLKQYLYWSNYFDKS